ncbi:ABC transporter permease [Frankia sp. AgKG'84/4]|uniref:ABC transporter permease n=1 Tax=Frankia sp. AgKG'84/4 TaxID=573490 RepID=UPI00200CCD55|nr:ABC transporter permease [Frankia sp. AgKG'84/4]MCL9792917.1 ABC transporter permease [Frankia sp. AgKG'84/4]
MTDVVVASPTLPDRSVRRFVAGAPTIVLTGTLLLVVLAVTVPGIFTDVSPTAVDPSAALAAPSGAHWFGTDQLGRDVFTRVLHGARGSLLLGFGTVVLAVWIGSALGLAAALGGRLVDLVFTRVMAVMIAIPPLLLALLVIAVLGPGSGRTMIAMVAALTPLYGRLVRAEAMVARRSGYVEAARALGVGRTAVVVRHVLPNVLGPTLALATVEVGSAIVYVAGLSFLGLGPRPPSPQWGLMLAEGRDYLRSAWWVGVCPGAVLALTVLAFQAAARRAQERLARRGAG